MDTTDDSGYAAYQRLMAALSFAEIPHLLPQYLVRRRHRRGASHVPQTVAARDPQKGDLLSAIRWRQPRWSNSPASGSTGQRPICAKLRCVSTRTTATSGSRRYDGSYLGR
jgi:hypothetical protein